MKTPLGLPGVATNEERIWRRTEPVQPEMAAGMIEESRTGEAYRVETIADPTPGEWRLEVWVRRYTSMVYSLALRMTGDAGWAEELTQDVFLELDRNRARMQGEEHIRRWLRQVVMHRAVDAMRRRNSREPGWREGRWMGLEDWREAAPEYAGQSARQGARVERWLMKLPERQREAVLLRYQEAMTPEEMAAALRAPVATVKSHLQRGLRALRGLAEKEMSDAQ